MEIKDIISIMVYISILIFIIGISYFIIQAEGVVLNNSPVDSCSKLCEGNWTYMATTGGIDLCSCANLENYSTWYCEVVMEDTNWLG